MVRRWWWGRWWWGRWRRRVAAGGLVPRWQGWSARGRVEHQGLPGRRRVNWGHVCRLWVVLISAAVLTMCAQSQSNDCKPAWCRRTFCASLAPTCTNLYNVIHLCDSIILRTARPETLRASQRGQLGETHAVGSVGLMVQAASCVGPKRPTATLGLGRQRSMPHYAAHR